jgi:hypothetical protein
MRTVGVLVLLLAPGLAAAADVVLIKEEIAAIRKELISVRMSIRRTEATKQALAAAEKLSPADKADTPEFRDTLAKDDVLAALRKALAEAEHIVAISKRGPQLELAEKRILDIRKRIDERTKDLLAQHSKKEQTKLGSRLLYLQKLRGILEKDLEALSRELKVLGG